MKFGLSIPFRTLLNLESEIVGVHRKDAAYAIEEAFASLFRNTAVEDPVILKDETEDGLKTLSQDVLPWFSRAIVSMFLSSSYIQNVRESFLLSRASSDEATLISALELGAKLEIYDNTIGIVSVTGRLDLALAPAGWKADDFEQFLSDLAEQFVKPINNLLIAPALKAFDGEEVEWPHKPYLVRPRREYQIFFDLNDHPFPHWDEERSCFFWTHRVYALEGLDTADPTVRELLRLEEIETYGKREKDGSVCYVGSSLVPRETDVGAFLKASSIVQYFYCILDVLNDNQNEVYRALSAAENKKDVDQLVPRFYRMENFVDYVFNESRDAEISLQGARRRYFETLIEIFGFTRLVEALRSRDQLVRSRMDRKSFEVAKTDRKLLQFALFVLGATQVFNFVLDIFGYVKNPESGQLPGVIDLFGWLDVNLTFNAITLLVIAGALYASFRRS